jgi:hypothetical protein
MTTDDPIAPRSQQSLYRVDNSDANTFVFLLGGKFYQFVTANTAAQRDDTIVWLSRKMAGNEHRFQRNSGINGDSLCRVGCQVSNGDGRLVGALLDEERFQLSTYVSLRQEQNKPTNCDSA